ncbi:MAG: chlorite dismutase family protein [Blastocatellia bacterium]|nr:chlorite dismutase family protein [Blastocatellia bacterium]
MKRDGINPVSFLGGQSGLWKVVRLETIVGEGLSDVGYLDVKPIHISVNDSASAKWILRGTNVHTRYAERREVDKLVAHQATLGRPEAVCAALIPIRKSAQWWGMAQDERRRVFEDESRHIAMSIDYSAAIARRLYQSRELGEAFDFLTWFEFTPENEKIFDKLLAKMRAAKEWSFVDREIDIRLIRV